MKVILLFAALLFGAWLWRAGRRAKLKDQGLRNKPPHRLKPRWCPACTARCTLPRARQSKASSGFTAAPSTANSPSPEHAERQHLVKSKLADSAALLPARFTGQKGRRA